MSRPLEVKLIRFEKNVMAALIGLAISNVLPPANMTAEQVLEMIGPEGSTRCLRAAEAVKKYVFAVLNEEFGDLTAMIKPEVH
jgi:hypothetical protein